jgi:hypothetical protein
MFSSLGNAIANLFPLGGRSQEAEFSGFGRPHQIYQEPRKDDMIDAQLVHAFFANDYWPMEDPYGMLKMKPWDFEKIIICRRDWDKPVVTRYADLHPLMNIHGLYWKPLRFAENAKLLTGKTS